MVSGQLSVDSYKSHYRTSVIVSQGLLVRVFKLQDLPRSTAHRFDERLLNGLPQPAGISKADKQGGNLAAVVQNHNGRRGADIEGRNQAPITGVINIDLLHVNIAAILLGYPIHDGDLLFAVNSPIGVEHDDGDITIFIGEL